MNETSQAIATVKREVQLAEWQRQIRERQEQGVTVEEWCENLGISKGTYYHRLRKVREYMCQQMGVMDNGVVNTAPHATAVVPVRTAQPKASVEMQLGELQIKFKATPRNSDGAITKSIFSSDDTKIRGLQPSYRQGFL